MASDTQGPAPNLAQLEGSSKKNKTLRLCCQAVPGLLAAGVQIAPDILAATEVREGRQLDLTGTINLDPPLARMLGSGSTGFQKN